MAVRSIVKSASGQTSAIKASLKRSVKEKVTSANSWWGEKSPKSSSFANGVSGAMAAWAVKNTSPTSRGNQSMIGMGAGAVSSLPGIGGLVYGLGGALGVISGGAQVIGGIAATFTGAGAAVGIPMILKGAVEVVVSVQVLSAAVEGEESKNGREATDEESEWEEYLDDESPKNGQVGRQNGNTPRNNRKQNEQVDKVVKELRLDKRQRRQLHNEITHQGYGYQEIFEIAKNLFGIG